MTKALLPSYVIYLCGVLTLAAMLFFKDEPFLTTVAIAFLSGVVFFQRPSIGQALIYIFLFMSALAVEIIVVRAGIWSYATTAFFNIPLWIPFVWVNGGFVFIQFKEDIDRYWRKRS